MNGEITIIFKRESTIKCYKCGKEGHKSDQCFKK